MRLKDSNTVYSCMETESSSFKQGGSPHYVDISPTDHEKFQIIILLYKFTLPFSKFKLTYFYHWKENQKL